MNSLLAVIIILAIFSLFIFYLGRRAATLVKGAKEQKLLEDSSIKILALKDGEETKSGEERAELVFFVEHERFKIQDLLESAADLQGQSLCSSLYKVQLKNKILFSVKRLKKLQVSIEEFGSTMNRIGNLKHPNILSLIAYYSSNEEKLLVYRYQNNGSLLSLLENYADGKRDFPWRLRLSIAQGIAKGLEFLHQKTGDRESIPHGNLKLSNILLNENEEPLISEFGFQRYIDPKRAGLYCSNGYKAPEKSLTEEADVFSFGVVLLELLTSKTVERSGIDLPKWVKAMVREEWTGEVFDKEVNKAGKHWAFPLLNVALNCVSHSPTQRPNISEVLGKIEEAINGQEDLSFSSMSSVDSNHRDGCLLHTTIPENWDSASPGLNR
ncbi:hypothetical protein ACHQM5_004134 [Ranunculus cassubicifolius]